MLAGDERGEDEWGRGAAATTDDVGSKSFEADSGYEYGRDETDEVDGREEKSEVDVEAVAGPDDMVGAYWVLGEEYRPVPAPGGGAGVTGSI